MTTLNITYNPAPASTIGQMFSIVNADAIYKSSPEYQASTIVTLSMKAMQAQNDIQVAFDKKQANKGNNMGMPINSANNSTSVADMQRAQLMYQSQAIQQAAQQAPLVQQPAKPVGNVGNNIDVHAT